MHRQCTSCPYSGYGSGRKFASTPLLIDVQVSQLSRVSNAPPSEVTMYIWRASRGSTITELRTAPSGVPPPGGFHLRVHQMIVVAIDALPGDTSIVTAEQRRRRGARVPHVMIVAMP